MTQDCAGSRFARRLRPGLPLGVAALSGLREGVTSVEGRTASLSPERSCIRRGGDPLPLSPGRSFIGLGEAAFPEPWGEL